MAAHRQIVRKSNIELLRIIVMIFIIAHHYSYHSNFEFPTETITVNKLWIQFIAIGGKIGVNIFVLISGYFLISCSKIKVDKMIRIWIQMITYSVMIFVVFIGFKLESFSIKDLATRIFPVTFSHWGFASTYFVLYMLSPYINILLNTLDKKSYQKLLMLLTFCWSIIPTFLVNSWQCNDLLWFIYLYALAGYIKMNVQQKIKGGVYIALAVGLTALTFFSVVIFDFIGRNIPVFAVHTTFFYSMNRLPILLIATFLFMGFLKINIRYSRLINIISSATFGVYLIHEDQYVRPFLWKTVFNNASFSESNVLIPYSIAVIVIVYIICTLIELFRIYFLEKRYLLVVEKISDAINRYLEVFFSHSFLDGM